MTGGENRCRVCRVNPADTFEHVPPRKALNDQPTQVYGLMDWLAAEESAPLTGGRIEQRGSGGLYLCGRCNNNTGSWYGKELAVAASSGARILRKANLDELDQLLDPMYAAVKFKQSATGPHPLRFIKQVVTMLLAVSPVSFSDANPDLADFVLDRERTGLDPKYQFYLALFAGPRARTVGGAIKLNVYTGESVFMVEVAYPPYAYLMTVGADTDTAVPTVNITGFVNVGYNQRADVELEMLVGFGHPEAAMPGDYRTRAMIERDREENEQFMREHGMEPG